jgi:epoxyqueuosine reductase
MITPHAIKNMARRFGADLCGIAPVERFRDAPRGFRPGDIFRQARSAVVIAKRLPDAALLSENPVPYTFACGVTLEAVNQMICQLALSLQEMSVAAVPIPSEPYLYWDEKRREGRGILSLKHAGFLAGLGVLGRNTLLTNDTLGNRMTLGALLLNVALPGDSIAKYTLCSDNCQVCINACPAKALDGKTVVQKSCREVSQVITKKGCALYLCNTCRVICPGGKGKQKRSGRVLKAAANAYGSSYGSGSGVFKGDIKWQKSLVDAGSNVIRVWHSIYRSLLATRVSHISTILLLGVYSLGTYFSCPIN